MSSERDNLRTPSRQLILLTSDRFARRLKNDYLGTEHFLLGILADGQSSAAKLLVNLGVDSGAALVATQKVVSTAQVVSDRELPWTPRLRSVIDFALEECERYGCTRTTLDHAFLGLLRVHRSVAVQVLHGQNVDLLRLADDVHNRLNNK